MAVHCSWLCVRWQPDPAGSRYSQPVVVLPDTSRHNHEYTALHTSLVITTGGGDVFVNILTERQTESA